MGQPQKLLIAALLAFLFVPGFAVAEQEPKRTITLSGVGEVAAAPDQATISTGVITRAQTAKDALGENTASTQSVIDALKAAGIEDRDLQTSSFSINPVYDNRNANGQRELQIIGYEVRNTVTVRIRALQMTGEILDLVVQQGSNEISGPNFGLSNRTEVEDEAITKAVAQATARAKLLAEAAGVALGPVLTLSYGNPRVSAPRSGFAQAAVASAAPVPIQAGELTVQANVSMVFEISN